MSIILVAKSSIFTGKVSNNDKQKSLQLINGTGSLR